MNNSNRNHLNILDLPGELFLIIFEKLDTIDVFYSFADVNERLNRLALDSLNIRDLNMTSIMTIDSLDDHITSIDAHVLSRICQKILHRIHAQVYKLTVEQNSMKEVLHATNYPQLYSLSLVNFQVEVLYQYLTTDLILRDLLTKQITHLNIDINTTTAVCSRTVAEIFALILSLCKGLIVLNFGDMLLKRKHPTPAFYVQLPSFMSSSLSKLKINVKSFADCLYLLDGRLDNLSTLIIIVPDIRDPVKDIGGGRKLTKLKYFSFNALNYTFRYDDLIVPLLCRMVNLEELKLSLLVLKCDSTYLDGIQLYDQFLIYMTQLKKFTFSIRTTVCNVNTGIDLPSNEDVQGSFIGRVYKQVASYVHTNSMKTRGDCHIYSLPFDFDHFVELDNSFQGGMFHKVRYLTMSDALSFEYKLIKIISEDFPLLQFLHICNDHGQKDKKDSPSLITFPHLTFLHIKYAHDDYAELFLLKKNTHLPRLFNLCIKNESLTTITNNFIADAEEFNFGTLKSLDLCQSFVRPENFHRYFPLL